jgi:hypothetical protein
VSVSFKNILFVVSLALCVVGISSCSDSDDSDRRLQGTWAIDFDSLDNGYLELRHVGSSLSGKAWIAGEWIEFDHGRIDSYDSGTKYISLYTEHKIWPQGQPAYVSLSGTLNADWTIVVGSVSVTRQITSVNLLRDTFIMRKE